MIVDAATPEPSTPSTPPQEEYSVVAEGLTKRYGQFTAVDHVDLRVRKGEFFGFLGPNGAGKSTTIKILCGLLKFTEGRATVAGYDVASQPLAVKSQVGVLPEEVNTYERLTGWELLTFAGRMYGLSGTMAAERAEDLMKLLELNEVDRHKLVVDYSMGMKKKIALACALIHNPRVLFLDEPFNGIDAIVSRAIRQVLQRITQKGVTIFFSSHILEVVEKLCSSMAIIHHGRIVAQGTMEDLRRQSGSETMSLEEIFVHLVGQKAEPGDLSWM